MTVAENIKKIREQFNLTQAELGEIAGVSDKAVWTWENGTAEPRLGAVQKIAEHFGITKGSIIDDESDLPPNILTPAAYPLPILGTICAGDGILCEENFDGFFFVDNSIRASYCLHVHGDSMMDAEIYDEDIVFIRKDFEYEDGKIYAVVYGAQQDAVLRKIYRDGSKVILTPCNSSYKPLVMDPDDIFIIGECVGMYRPMK